MNDKTNIAFIGGGNMAGAMVGGLINAGWSADALSVSEPNADRRRELSERFGVEVHNDNELVAGSGEVVVLAVKPQVMQLAVEPLRAALQKNKPLVISIAAGIRSADISRWAGERLAVVRAMPNTPALVGAGFSGLFGNALAGDAERDLADKILRGVGETLWVAREPLLDAVTAVSGSGPAYFFKLMESLADAAARHGLEADADRIAVQTAFGAAQLARQHNTSPADLRRQVTSPGGTTEAALDKMRELGFDAAVEQATDAARKRSEEIADALGKG